MLSKISIHALLAESDAYMLEIKTLFTISIYALLAESDAKNGLRICLAVYFYPRSPCGERPNALSPKNSLISISIHALLAESDALTRLLTMTVIVFLSTLSLRRATLDFSKSLFSLCYFYPRSPCGERRSKSRCG